ncbi:hypothetical protein LCGC14_1460020 [marine sediment metagenome]|uniref:Uncharacterized protein n=1 Tax=marine sediment metagenome TaxID=412755 RepID=A0A0F9K1D9_9ZZZZ
MAYIPSLHKIQLGLEAVYGDGAAVSLQPPGINNVRIDPKVEAEQLKDKRGTTMPAHEAFIKRRWVEGTIDGYLNYQQAYVWLDSMFGEATPVGNDRTYLGSVDWASEVEKSIALYYGQTGLVYKAAGVLPTNLQITGASGEPIQFSYNFFGQEATDGATISGVSLDTVEWMFGYDTTIYLDAGRGANHGTTPMTDIGFRFAADITANRKPVWHLGNQTPDTYSVGEWGGSLNLVLESDATVLSHLGDIMDATGAPIVYVVRIDISNGSDAFQLDFVGEAITPPNLITDTDGVVTVELALQPTYGTDQASCWGALLTIVP